MRWNPSILQNIYLVFLHFTRTFSLRHFQPSATFSALLLQLIIRPHAVFSLLAWLFIAMYRAPASAAAFLGFFAGRSYHLQTHSNTTGTGCSLLGHCGAMSTNQPGHFYLRPDSFKILVCLAGLHASSSWSDFLRSICPVSQPHTQQHPHHASVGFLSQTVPCRLTTSRNCSMVCVCPTKLPLTPLLWKENFT